MTYRYWDAKRVLASSVAPGDPGEAGAYRDRVIAMLRDAGVRFDEAGPAAGDPRWLILVCDEVDSMAIQVIAVPAGLAESWGAVLARASYLSPAGDAPGGDEWLASVRLGNALGQTIEPDDLVDWADHPGCPTPGELAAGKNALAGCAAVEIDRDGRLPRAAALLGGPILGVTRFALFS